ncbi:MULTISPECIES: phosphotransferase [Streptomyces]|uniref:phosphotransferase n=1 Tax=Streptomyces TaxID=1883 RepID=UPI00068DD2A3|nr:MULTISPECIES: phosphotransferase [Streptomyces]
MTEKQADRAARAAVAVAAEYGLDVTRPVVLRDASNVLVRLDPLPVVARVAGLMAGLRDGTGEWLARDVAVLAHLDGRDATRPCPPPLPPGPHHRDGLVLTFSALEHPDPAATLDPGEVGRSLRRLHANLRDLPVRLPALGLVEEGRDWLRGLTPGCGLTADELRRLSERYDEVRAAVADAAPAAQQLHGDAHAANLMSTPRGLVWTDFEDAASGPPLWDLACLAARARALGTGERGYDADWADAAVRAYGADPRDPLLDLLVTARTLAVAAWGLAVSDAAPRMRAASLARAEWILANPTGRR